MERRLITPNHNLPPNPTAPVDAPIARLFAFECPWRRATEVVGRTFSPMMPEAIMWAAILGAARLIFRRFVLIPRRQAQERTRRELEATREAKAKADAELGREHQRRQRVKNCGRKADALLSSIIKAKLELDDILASVKDFFKTEDVEYVNRWAARYKELMQFQPYGAVIANTDALGRPRRSVLALLIAHTVRITP
jgi:hypothetical protein